MEDRPPHSRSQLEESEPILPDSRLVHFVLLVCMQVYVSKQQYVATAALGKGRGRERERERDRNNGYAF